MSASDHRTPATIELECPDCGNYHPAPDDSAFDDLLETACTEVGESSQRIYRAFRIDESTGRWDIDDVAGDIWWTHADGAVARAKYHLAGTWVETSESFMWAWDHPHATETTIGAAKRALEYGREHGHAVLTTRMLGIGEADSWHVAKIVAYLARLPGIYRAKWSDKVWAYFAFTEPKWDH